MAGQPGDFFGDLFDSVARSSVPPRPGNKPVPPAEKGVQLRGRDIDGTFYLRGEDVVALLEANRLLPKITARIKARLGKP